MEEFLCNSDLFFQNFNIDGKECKLSLQLYIAKDSSALRILILHSEKNADIVMLAWNKHSGPFSIPEDWIPSILYAIRQIPIPDKQRDSLESLKKIELPTSNILEQSSQFVALSKNVFVLTQHPNYSNQLSEDANIEIELIHQPYIRPEFFVYAAFDSVISYLYFEISQQIAESNKNWGILSPITMHTGSLSAEGFYAQELRIVSETNVSFLCQQRIVSTLERRKMGQMHVEGVSPFELMDFIVASAGFANSVSFPASYVERPNWYTVVIPTIGLKIETEIGIGNVQFCSSENDEIKRIVPFDNRFLLFQSFAVVHVNNSKIYAAVMQAKKQVEQGLDLLINMIKDDSLYSMHSIGNVLLERSNTRFEKKVSLSSFIYVESPLTNSKMSCDLSNPDSTPDLVVNSSLLTYKKELEKAELLLLRANGANDKNSSPLFDALKWVRRAWDADDFDDKIIYSIIALEFIVSKEPNIPFMEKPLRKKCKGEIRRVIAAANLSGLNTIDYTKSVCDKFDRVYTETPFMQKLRNLIDRLNIPLSDKDMELIESARRQRNHIVHGDSESRLPTDDVYRLCESISRITFYKIHSLETL